jgi:flagellum-specific peptidoglycan hydrolase FlgJ
MDSAEGYGKNRRMEKSKFAAYPSYDAFFQEWPKTFSQPRYSEALKQKTPESFAKSLGKAGYFTEDPNKYANLMKNIYRDIDKMMMDPSIIESRIAGQGGTR